MNSKFEYIPEIKEYITSLQMDKSPYTIISYVSAIDRFLTFAEINSFDEINTSLIREYQLKLKNDELSNASINTKMRPLRAFFNWLITNQYVSTDENPFSNVNKLKEPERKKAFLTDEEILRMFNACQNLEEQALFAVLLYTGARRSEFVNLKLDDLNGNKITIIGKGDKERYVYLPKNAEELLYKYLSSKKHGKSEWLFPSRRGENYTPEAIRLKLKRIAKNADFDDNRINHISPHTMRRTTIANLIAQGANMAVIQNVAGHADIATTMLYANVRDSAVENVMTNQKSYF